MRPCRQCRTPIENNVAVCERCGASQDEAPKVNSEASSPPRRGPAHRLVSGFADIAGFEPGFALLLCLPLALGGAIGFAIGGWSGAAVGAATAIAFLIGIALLAESGG